MKRVVGVAGDHVQISGGLLHLNGIPVPREQRRTWELGGAARARSVTEYREVLPNGRRYSIVDADDAGPFDNTEVYVVPPEHYFVLGDNRDNSLDSRMPQIGMISARSLVGRASFIFFSHSGEFGLTSPVEWLHAVRVERIGQLIE